MKIDVNGTIHEVEADNLAAALDLLGWTGMRVATAHNGRFVPVSARPQTVLSEGDRLEVLAAMQGG